MLSNEEIETLISDWSEKISKQLENIETSGSAEELCKWIQRTGSLIKPYVQSGPPSPNGPTNGKYIPIKALNVNPKMGDLCR